MKSHEQQRLLVTKLVKKESINWPREVKLSKELLKQYPDIDFWQQLELGYLLNSLAFLKSERGKEELNRHFNLFKLAKLQKKTYDLESEKILNIDAPKNTKPTILDFVKS